MGICLNCGYDTDRHICLNSEGALPLPGDWSVCFNCIEITRFTSDFDLRKATQHEVWTLRITAPGTYSTLKKAKTIIRDFKNGKEKT